MKPRFLGLLRFTISILGALIFTCLAWDPRGAGQIPLPQHKQENEILIWRVSGSHRDEAPDKLIPKRLRFMAEENGYRLVMETYPAQGFSRRFFDAIARRTAPDVLLMNTIELEMAGLMGFAYPDRNEPASQPLLLVAGTFEYERWVYLIPASRNFNVLRKFALRDPDCLNTPLPQGWKIPGDEVDELKSVAVAASQAYLTCDQARLRSISDPVRIGTGCLFGRKQSRVFKTEVCAMTGNGRLAFVKSVSSFEVTGGTLGQLPLLAVLRKEHAEWRLLTITNDPVAEWMEPGLGILSHALADEEDSRPPLPARLITQNGIVPKPVAGERFGDFAWQPSPSPVVCQIIEFEYEHATRLFLFHNTSPATDSISAGKLWSTCGPWHWRVWSIAADGRIAISESRFFRH